MTKYRPVRVMWLLNHSKARAFEVPQLLSTGIDEVFVPKIMPYDPRFRSGSISWDYDAQLTISAQDLHLFNETNWYAPVDKSVWRRASECFDAIFCILHDKEPLFTASKYFSGAILLRAYGLQKEQTYDQVLDFLSEGSCNLRGQILSLGKRFFFAEAYGNLADVEPDYLKARRLFLPLGLPSEGKDQVWIGNTEKVLVTYPDLEINAYYATEYGRFKKHFRQFPYDVAGRQDIQSSDGAVLGWVSADARERQFIDYRLSYYDSAEPRHIHYHPLEAILAGQPLVFRAGGLLDSLGGSISPGRCQTTRAAKKVIQRLLKGDDTLCRAIIREQKTVLDHLHPDSLRPAWQDSLATVLQNKSTPSHLHTQAKTTVAVIVPVAFRGGTLEGAIALANNLVQGSALAEEHSQIRLYYPENEIASLDSYSHLMDPKVKVVPFHLRILDKSQSKLAMTFSEHKGWRANNQSYCVPEDGIAHGFDADVWVFISDRLPCPALPLRPTAIVVYDYLQRFYPHLDPNDTAVHVAREADLAIATTKFTYSELTTFAGLDPNKTELLPPIFLSHPPPQGAEGGALQKFFMWSTNLGPHKNIKGALAALRVYYEELGGELDCVVTGVNTESINEIPEVATQLAVILKDGSRNSGVILAGELPPKKYIQKLRNAVFNWHPTVFDNGTFSAVHAAAVGVPTLSSNYPAMNELDDALNLQLRYHCASDPAEMADAIKSMEVTGANLSVGQNAIEMRCPEKVAEVSRRYWRAISGIA
ncbi:hypothetical protein N9485_00775 [Luminiphilus sp.]|nr:hypothetical protein [Luminiphilus sp.]